MRWIMRIIGALVVAVILLAAALLALPGDKIARIAADQIEARTGRAIEISGDTSISYYPVLGVETGPVSLANAPWSDNGPMFRAEALKIGVDLAALLGGDIQIKVLDAEAPQILLERNAEGLANWQIAGPADAGAPTASQATGGALTLETLFVRDARIRYIDARAGADRRLEGLEMTLSLPEARGPAELTLKLAMPGGEITGEGRVERAADFLDGQVSPLSLSFEAPGGTATFDGRGGLAPEATGRLELSVSDAARLFEVLGEAADLPAALSRDLGFAGDVTLTPNGQVFLRDGMLRGAGNQAGIEADLRPGKVTQVTAQIAAQSLDLTGFTGGSGSASSGAGWSRAPIDASALGLIEGDIALSAGTLALGVTELRNLSTRITIDRSRAVAQISRLSVFGGSVTGQLVANNRAGLSIGGDLSASEVDLNRMLRDLAGITRFTGSAAARLNFLASGSSVAAWMSSLSGDGSLETGRGTISGIDLDRLFRSGDASGGTTIFDATKASFSISEGVLRNDDLNMQLASITATGEGTVDLGQQRLNYLFTPAALKDDQGRGIAIPVRIRGPWSSPQILPDLERAIQLNADIDKQELEQRAKDKVQSELQDALGVEQGEGESGEDAIRRGLEDKLKNELQNLFK
ncbi:AsmA protein [Pseudooceanicola antarcticus]|uniref:AsmA family protein n=1 Tax=Pseudooceanicola antarcticus TaxID=1247613 RepID=A0A285IIK9_9RHOB|nr:AsmA family protein [Pseudooceanicola antarcticus]PJE28932.1 AsmA family protein [Pseudooceanicola antarcticus]SNY47627.1 AsmA protein [Pseudooceanicola antarcticus]